MWLRERSRADGTCPKKQTPAQAAHYWDAAPDAAGFAGTADYGTD